MRPAARRLHDRRRVQARRAPAAPAHHALRHLEVLSDDAAATSDPAPQGGLEGLRIVEVGQGVSAAWATKWLADLGADVIKVEPPGGDALRQRGPFVGEPDPERAGFFHYLNAGKRGVVLDLAASAGREGLAELVSTADALVHNLAPGAMQAAGLGFEALHAKHPGLVVTSITPFGLTGPRAHWRAEELTVAHGGGWGYISPGASSDLERPPLKAFGHQSDFHGGSTAAATTLAALYRARVSGLGEHVDLSVQAVVASILESTLPYYTYPGIVATRFGRRGLNPWGIYECSDGRIFLVIVEEDQWQRLIEFMGRPDWATLEIFGDARGRFQNADVLNLYLREWIAGWKTLDLFHAGQEQRICFAPVLEVSELATQQHLKDRGFLVEQQVGDERVIVPGAPYRLAEPWWLARRPSPRLGEHTSEVAAETHEPKRHVANRKPPARPLDGVRVADFTWVWAGPFGAMQLAHLGAEVIKIESRTRSDVGRRLAIYPPDMEPGLNRSGYFNQWNQGKRSFALDLSQPGALDIAKRIVAESDVVIENFATGVMDRIGLGWDVLREINPRLVMASISGYGQTGVWKDYSAYGPATPPLSGLSALSGYSGGPPSEVGIAVGDPAAGITAAVGICAALLAREKTGRGQRIDVSLWEATTVMTAEGWLAERLTGAPPARMGNRDPLLAPHGCYRCSGDERWVSIACATDAEWAALCGLVDPTLSGDDRFTTRAARKQNEDALDSILSSWTATRDAWEITEALQARGVPAYPSVTCEEVCRDPQLEARGFFERLEHPEVGVKQHAGIPWRLAIGPNGVRSPAPLLGADTEAVLRELLGCSEAEIESLRSAQVAG